MNTEPQTETIVPLQQSSEAPPACLVSTRRRHGKVAKLPKPVRDKINAMLDDGATYIKIIEQLGAETPGITISNLSNWHAGGYQDYLRNQTWANAIHASQEKVLDAAAEDPVKFADAGVQLAATGICELLAELSRLQSSDEKAAENSARIANSMARLARVILSYDQDRRAVAKEKAGELKQLDPEREFNDNEHLAIVDRVNRLFGLRQYRKPKIEAALNGPLSGVRPSSAAATSITHSASANSADPTTASASQISNFKSEIPKTENETQTIERNENV